MTDHVQTWLGNVQGSEYGFFKAVVQALESFNNGDTNSLGKMLCITHGKTCKRIKRKELERLPYAAHLKRILSYAFEGVEYKFSKDADFGVVFNRGDNGGVNTSYIEALKILGGKTVRAKEYKEAFPPIVKEQKTREADAVVQSSIRMAKKNGLTKEAYLQMCEALWNTTMLPSDEPAH